MGLRFIGIRINYAEYRETDRNELVAIEAETNDELATMPRSEDDRGRQNDEAIAGAVRRAIAAWDRGDQVFLARDGDGPHFAVAAPDEYRDAPVLIDAHDDDCPTYQHAHVADLDCDCGAAVLLEGELAAVGADAVLPTGETRIEFSAAGEWRVRCAGCGIVYVLTPADHSDPYGGVWGTFAAIRAGTFPKKMAPTLCQFPIIHKGWLRGDTCDEPAVVLYEARTITGPRLVPFCAEHQEWGPRVGYGPEDRRDLPVLPHEHMRASADTNEPTEEDRHDHQPY